MLILSTERQNTGSPINYNQLPKDWQLPQIGSYKALSLLGTGQFGTVFKVINPKYRYDPYRFLALKSSPISHAEVTETEVRALRSMPKGGPNLLDFFYHEGHTSIVMTLFDHESHRPLNNLIHAGQISPNLAIIVIEQLAGFISSWHEKRMENADLKPANMLVDLEQSDSPNLRVVDWGFTRFANTKKRQEMGIIGTLAYLAPEMIIKQSEFELMAPETVVFFLAILLFEMLVGRLAIDASDTYDLLYKAKNNLRTHNPTFNTRDKDQLANQGINHGSLESVLLTATDPKMDQRFPSIEQFLNLVKKTFAQAASTPKKDNKPKTAARDCSELVFASPEAATHRED